MLGLGLLGVLRLCWVIRGIHKEGIGIGLGRKNGYWLVMTIGYDTMIVLLL